MVRKHIKNVHLSVHPPTGRVRIAAPQDMDVKTVRLFALAKLDWIKRQQRKLASQDREPPREFLDREGHYLWGRRMMLRVLEVDVPRSVEVRHSALVLTVHSGDPVSVREHLLSRFYREHLRAEATPLIAQWERRLGVNTSALFVQHMKTKWGSCNPHSRAIRLNTELTKKPPECLQYVVVHELSHLLETTHSRRFISLLDKHLPRWRAVRDNLNTLPLRHERWPVDECSDR
jgi:hypothetical protein